ncbi:MAG: hypothetical protein V1676_02565 [Candidatus Diapherotrites archaeon]
MAQAITLPSSKPKSTRDEVINLLSERWPLSVKQIHSEINRMNGGVSYQAVHKTLQQMEEDSIMEKQDGGYQLNRDWIKQLKAISGNLESSYENGPKETALHGKVFVLDSVNETDRLFVKLMKMQAVDGKKPVVCLHWCHLYTPLFVSREEYAQIAKLAENFEFYSLCRGDTIVDEWCAEFWRRQGVRQITGADVAATIDLLVIGDTVVEIHYSFEIKKRWDEIYGKIKKLDELKVDKLFEEIFEKEAKVKVVVYQDSHIAEEIRKQTFAYFKR